MAALVARAAAEMVPPPDPSAAMAAAQAVAGEIQDRHGNAAAAILFYGSCRRSGDASGLLDLYVLYDGHRRFHGSGARAAFTALLPPTVLLWKTRLPELGDVRAKVAVMSRRQFSRRVRATSLDTTIWARFCQPVTLLHARDEAAARWAAEACAGAFASAALWAARLGPARGNAAEFWRSLFARTYGAELRAETGARGIGLHEANSAWFDGGLPLAFAALALDAEPDGQGRLAPALPQAQRAGWRWAVRSLCGKGLNILRLVKAAFTFEGGADYLAWKISRHSGQPVHLTGWQRRHPILAAPLLLWRLWRRGLVR